MGVNDGKITDYRYQLIEVKANIEPDPTVEKLEKKALAPFNDELSKVVGQITTALNRGTTLESRMDNFLLRFCSKLPGRNWHSRMAGVFVNPDLDYSSVAISKYV